MQLKRKAKLPTNWVDHQACSLLQYINVITSLHIMRNYFNITVLKKIGANNFLEGQDKQTHLENQSPLNCRVSSFFYLSSYASSCQNDHLFVASVVCSIS